MPEYIKPILTLMGFRIVRIGVIYLIAKLSELWK